jgi:tetratricopeptide (TPR) repeat protein
MIEELPMRKKQALVCAALPLLLLILISCANKQETAERHLKAARIYTQNDQPDSALVEYKKAIEADPKNVRAHQYYQNLRRYTLGEEEAVLEEYKALSEKHARDPVFRYLYATLIDDPDEMKAEAEAVISMAPDNYYGYALLGTAYMRMNFDEDAIEAYQKAAEVDPDQIGSYSTLGYLYGNQGDYETANAWYLKAIERDSTRITYYSRIWSNEYEAAEDKEAVKKKILNEVDQVLEKYPENISLLSSTRYTLSRLGETERAEKLAERIAELDTSGVYVQQEAYNKIFSQPSNRDRMTVAEDFLEKYPDASMRRFVYSILFSFSLREPSVTHEEREELIQRWIGEFPEYAAAYNSIAWEYYLKNPETYEKAVEFARKGVELERPSRRGPVMDTYGWALVKTGRFEKAVEVLQKADSLYGNPDAEVAHHLGVAFLGAGDLDRGMESLILSLSLKDDDEVREAYFEAYEQKHGTRDGAMEQLIRKTLQMAAVEDPYPAPEFTLTSMTGDEVSLSDHIGKIILVNFWKPG